MQVKSHAAEADVDRLILIYNKLYNIYVINTILIKISIYKFGFVKCLRKEITI